MRWKPGTSIYGSLSRPDCKHLHASTTNNLTRHSLKTQSCAKYGPKRIPFHVLITGAHFDKHQVVHDLEYRHNNCSPNLTSHPTFLTSRSISRTDDVTNLDM